MVTATFWNGEPCTAVKGVGVVAENPNNKHYWARDLVGMMIQVVRVTYGGAAFDIDNRDGSGWRKVTVGGGSPRYRHRNVRLRPTSFVPDYTKAGR